MAAGRNKRYTQSFRRRPASLMAARTALLQSSQPSAWRPESLDSSGKGQYSTGFKDDFTLPPLASKYFPQSELPSILLAACLLFLLPSLNIHIPRLLTTRPSSIAPAQVYLRYHIPHTTVHNVRIPSPSGCHHRDGCRTSSLSDTHRSLRSRVRLRNRQCHCQLHCRQPRRSVHVQHVR